MTVDLFKVGKNIFRIAAKKKKRRAPTVFCQYVTQYNIKRVTRIKKTISIRELLVDPGPNSVN